MHVYCPTPKLLILLPSWIIIAQWIHFKGREQVGNILHNICLDLLIGSVRHHPCHLYDSQWHHCHVLLLQETTILWLSNVHPRWLCVCIVTNLVECPLGNKYVNERSPAYNTIYLLRCSAFEYFRHHSHQWSSSVRYRTCSLFCME